MDYTRFFARRAARRRGNLIRKFTEMRSIHPEAISLAAGMPNPESFPITAMTVSFKDNIVKKFTGLELNTSLQYGPSQGHLPLLTKYRGFQQKWHNPPVKDLDVIFMPGSQEGFCKLLDLFMNEGEPIMVQIPAYTATLGAIRPMAPDFIGIRQDKDGIIPDEIAKVCEDRIRSNKTLPKLLYVNPTGANPTGTVLTYQRKLRIYELAEQYDFIIIEDDPYYFLHFEGKQPASFLSIDIQGRVIRLDSFSKIMSAGIRVGAVTAHKEIIKRLIIHVENSVLQSSSLSQMLLLQFFDTWSSERFDQHFKEIQTLYRERRNLMVTALEKHLTGIAEWSVPKAGMFVWIKVPGIESALELAMEQLAPKGIFVIPGNAFNWDTDQVDQHLRLSYSYASAKEFDEALSVMSKMIREEIQSRK